MTTHDDDDDAPAPGFVRATPELLAEQRAACLAEFEEEAKRFFLLDCRMTAEEMPRYLAEAMRKATALYDEQSADFTRKVHEHARRGAAPLH